jgi:hypothetical protein
MKIASSVASYRQVCLANEDGCLSNESLCDVRHRRRRLYMIPCSTCLSTALQVSIQPHNTETQLLTHFNEQLN